MKCQTISIGLLNPLVNVEALGCLEGSRRFSYNSLFCSDSMPAKCHVNWNFPRYPRKEYPSFPGVVQGKEILGFSMSSFLADGHSDGPVLSGSSIRSFAYCQFCGDLLRPWEASVICAVSALETALLHKASF